MISACVRAPITGQDAVGARTQALMARAHPLLPCSNTQAPLPRA